jgi:anaerobic selenocysteine-containing dehydrogenase
VLTPLRRVGPKGSGRFEPRELGRGAGHHRGAPAAIAARDPQAILPYSYAGTMGLVQGEGMAARFFHRLGASLLDRTICASAGGEALAATYGAKVGMHVEQFAEHSRLILIWGSNPITSSLHFWTFAQQAKRAGAKLVCIDPRRTETADKCHQHIALLPGTDGALALGLMHELVATAGWTTTTWRAMSTAGRRCASARCSGRRARRRGLRHHRRRGARLARDYGSTKPAAIRLNYGMQRVRGGGNAVRLIALLPCLVGAWKHRPAGCCCPARAGSAARRDAWLQRPDLLAAEGAQRRARST